MNVETMLYAYLAVCTGMIVFNCVSIFVFRRRNRQLRWNSARLKRRIREEIGQMQQGQPVREQHIRWLTRKLRRTRALMAFDQTLEQLQEEQPRDTAEYLRQIRPVFTCLAMDHWYHDPMQKTYFAYVLRKYGILEGRPVPVLVEFLLRLLEENSLYCRESALQALYSTGDSGCVLLALRVVDDSEKFHHAKLLTDGLLTFRGDRQQLAQSLWRAFETFSVPMQTVILDFIRYGGIRLPEELLGILADENREDELRFSCIRYFTKFPYPPAYPLLLQFVEHTRNRRWEYAAIAATALGAYPGERSVLALKKALSSAVWYVRFNAAKSLEAFHLTYMELSDVMDSGDRYAREILQYQMDLARAKEHQEVWEP